MIVLYWDSNIKMHKNSDSYDSNIKVNNICSSNIKAHNNDRIDMKDYKVTRHNDLNAAIFVTELLRTGTNATIFS